MRITKRNSLLNIKVMGVYKGSSDTFAGLPTGSNGDWAILTTQDGNYKPGIYVYDGTNYSLSKEIQDFITLSDVDIQNKDNTDYGLVNPNQLNKYFNNKIVSAVDEQDAIGKIIPANGLLVIGIGTSQKQVINHTNTAVAYNTDDNHFTILEAKPAKKEYKIVKASKLDYTAIRDMEVKVKVSGTGYAIGAGYKSRGIIQTINGANIPSDKLLIDIGRIGIYFNTLNSHLKLVDAIGVYKLTKGDTLHIEVSTGDLQVDGNDIFQIELTEL